MDDAGPVLAADGEIGPGVGDQRIDEGAGFVAGCGVDDEAGGFVEDDQIGVFVEDGERDVLRLGHGRPGGGEFDSVGGAGADGFGGLGRGGAVAVDMTGLDQRLDARAGDRADALGQEAVEPIAFRFRRSGERQGGALG